MFCTQCGRELPKDGKPCVCGSGQAELVVQNRTAEQEWAADEAVVPAEPAESFEAIEPELPVWEEAVPAEEPENLQPEVQEAEPQAWVEAQPAPQEAYIPPVYAQPGYYAAPGYAVQQENAVIAAIRRVAGSPLFLIATIVVSLHFVLNLVNRLVPADITGMVYSIIAYLDSMIPGMGAEMMREIEPALADIRAAQATLSFVSLLGMITPALTVAALWMIYGSAKQADGPKTGGFTILQVLQILAVIVASFGVLLAVIVGGLLIALGQVFVEEMRYFGAMAGDMATGITVGSVVIAVLLVAGVIFGLIYTAKVLSTVAGVKKAIRSGVVMKKASGFVAVINLLVAAWLIIDVYGMLVLAGWSAALLNLVSAAANVLFALCIFKYNKVTKPLRVNKNTLGYIPQPPVYPQN